MAAKPNLEQKIAALADLPRQQLVELWISNYGCPPPSGVRQPLLVRAAAWHLQASQQGGLSSAGRRLLKNAIKQIASTQKDKIGGAVGGTLQSASGQRSDPVVLLQPPSAVWRAPPSPRPLPSPGARLIRDWNGKSHVVDVIESGYVHEGETYRSLTAIARKITSAHWSGPRFFGL